MRRCGGSRPMRDLRLQNDGVSKGKVVSWIDVGSKTRLDAVRATCRPSASCGSWGTGLVRASARDPRNARHIIGFIRATQPLRLQMHHFGAMTTSVMRIVERGLKESRRACRNGVWSTAGGCSSCRPPALNYYLLCAGPRIIGMTSRAVRHERMQRARSKDGLFVMPVPRMWCGLTTPHSCARSRRNVVEKFNAPMVKVTGGQRLDIFGIKNEGLPAVGPISTLPGWFRAMPWQGAAHRNTMCRSEWVPLFGTLRFDRLGVQLEKMSWGSWMPHNSRSPSRDARSNCA